jgi:hypothetical protein
MRIQNKTHYDTKYLRRLFAACERHEGIKHIGRIVNVVRANRSWVSGYAYVHGISLTMRLPKDALTDSIARVYIHEVGHNQGLRHSDGMIDICKIDVDWLKEDKYLGVDYKEIVPQIEKKVKPKRNVTEKRAEIATKHLNEWQRKLKRAQTAVAKYKKQVHYYEKRMAAAKSME